MTVNTGPIFPGCIMVSASFNVQFSTTASDLCSVSSSLKVNSMVQAVLNFSWMFCEIKSVLLPSQKMFAFRISEVFV